MKKTLLWADCTEITLNTNNKSFYTFFDYLSTFSDYYIDFQLLNTENGTFSDSI